MPLATHVLNIWCSMVAGGGVCCWLDWLMGGGWRLEVLLLLLLLTVPLSWTQVAGGWGDVAVLQAVAGLPPPYCTPPVYPGGRGRDDLPTRTVRNPEPQTIARKAGGELTNSILLPDPPLFSLHTTYQKNYVANVQYRMYALLHTLWLGFMYQLTRIAGVWEKKTIYINTKIIFFDDDRTDCWGDM